jgi:hypothetical protein
MLAASFTDQIAVAFIERTPYLFQGTDWSSSWHLSEMEIGRVLVNQEEMRMEPHYHWEPPVHELQVHHWQLKMQINAGGQDQQGLRGLETGEDPAMIEKTLLSSISCVST